MGSILSLVTIGFLVTAGVPAARPSAVSERPLTKAMLGMARVPLSPSPARVQVTATTAARQASRRGWASRHPVLTGALAGAAVGLVPGIVATVSDPECPEGRVCPLQDAGIFIYPAMGAMFGAMIGLVVGIFR